MKLTREEAKEMLPIIQAWVDGETVDWYDLSIGWRLSGFTKLRRFISEVFNLAYESPRIINISKNYTQKIQKSSFLTQHNR